MRKRHFLGAAALATGALPAFATAAHGAPQSIRGPTLLTLTGALGKVNRGRFDAARDQMMHKQKISFEKAYAFDFAALTALPAQTIAPTLEYDGKVHQLRGPALGTVVQAAGAAPGATLVLRAVDGYAVTLAPEQARRFIVATHLDGEAMALGGLGPLWALHDADRIPELMARPLSERYAGCPWALYHIAVQA